MLVLIIASISLSSSAQAMSPPQNSGHMDFDGYCKHLGYSGVQLDPTQKNVNGWGCKKADGTQVGVDLYDLCRWQYDGALPYPEYSDYSDPNSWFCSEVDLSSPALNPIGSDNIGERCPDYYYDEQGESLALGESMVIIGGGVLRENPSLSSNIIRELPQQDIIATVVGGPSCSYSSDTGCDIVLWYQYDVDGIVGWNTYCDPVYWQNSFGQNATESQPTLTTNITELNPDFSEPSVAAISAQLSPEAREKWEATASELRSRLPKVDFDKLVSLLYYSANMAECTLGVVEMVKTRVIVSTPLLVEACGQAAESIISILSKLEPAPSNEALNIFQQIWDWIKSLFGL